MKNVAIPSPRECPGMIGVMLSLLGAAGSLGAMMVYDRAVWGFALLALFAVLGWVSFIWCGVWAESTPDERTGVGFLGVVVGAIGLGVGLISLIVFGAPTWSYAIVVVSFIMFAGSFVQWGRDR
jgi:hypothetical protein